MTATALTLMLVVWLVILTATGYCFYKLLSSDRQFGQHEEQ